ncbi:hypothetical protein IC229_16625 [Spirosoma sp. BT702]|uniref:Uncharacterized protein n=1 Tax=Spirosoma profusum TaxID=2771354 RepID=A0A926XY17_9BACT|nr:hypothetical protein [Spirosoma profusum]MBD2702280.1 hypothetical protein [Spirosoma profusum]
METPVNQLALTIPMLLVKFSTALVFALLVGLAGCKKETTQVEPMAVFEGTYEKQSTDPAKRYTFTINPVASKTNTVTISNFANFIPNVEATTSGNKLTIEKQVFPVSGGGQISLTGEGILSGDMLTINYSVRGSSSFDGLTEAKRK